MSRKYKKFTRNEVFVMSEKISELTRDWLSDIEDEQLKASLTSLLTAAVQREKEKYYDENTLACIIAEKIISMERKIKHLKSFIPEKGKAFYFGGNKITVTDEQIIIEPMK